MNKPVFDYRAHKTMWGILAETRWERKDMALEKMGVESSPYPHTCYACAAQTALTGDSCRCQKGLCPLDWGKETYRQYPCETGEGLYFQWCSCDPYDIEQRKALAAEIRDLPLSKNARKLYTIID